MQVMGAITFHKRSIEKWHQIIAKETQHPKYTLPKPYIEAGRAKCIRKGHVFKNMECIRCGQEANYN